MKVFFDVHDEGVKKLVRPVVTSGVFDGLHLGHQKVIDSLKEWTQEVGGTATVLTFSPHPQVVLRDLPPREFPYLTNIPHRLILLEKAGVEAVIVQTFDRNFSRIPADHFLSDLVGKKIGADHFLMGYDARVGYRARGDYEYLSGLAPDLGMEVRQVPPLTQGGDHMSSTLLRECVQKGKLEEAARGLGRNYSYFGKVVEGDGRGRQIGFPTANVDGDGEISPPNGVYAVKVTIYPVASPYPALADQTRYGLVNIGVRPTFDGKRKQVEVHLPEFSGDLYGQYLNVAFLEKIRDEKKFSSVDELVAQIRRDCDTLNQLYTIENIKGSHS